jgi:hypothetical protein
MPRLSVHLRGLVVVTALLLAAAVARADDPAIEVTGSARVVNEDRVAARRRALEDAMRRAVEQAVEVALGPGGRAGRGDQARAALGQARALVSRYRVLAETESGGVYQVQIAATIDSRRLAAALSAGAGHPRPGRPTVRLTVSGEAPGVLVQALGDVGVAVAPAAAPELRVVVTPVDEGEVRGAGVVAARVTLAATLSLGGGATRSLAAAARRFATAPAAAREAAYRGAAGELAQAVSRAVQPVAAGGVSLRLTGRFGYRHYLALRQALSGIPQVGAATPRRFGYRFVDLWVGTSLAPAELARRVAAAPVTGLGVTVAAVEGAEVRLRLEVTEGTTPEGLP